MEIIKFTCPDEPQELTEWKKKAVETLSECYAAAALELDAKIRLAAKQAIETGDGFIIDKIRSAYAGEFTTFFGCVLDAREKPVEVTVNLLDRTITFGK